VNASHIWKSSYIGSILLIFCFQRGTWCDMVKLLISILYFQQLHGSLTVLFSLKWMFLLLKTQGLSLSHGNSVLKGEQYLGHCSF
jgi:hypothetical protein